MGLACYLFPTPRCKLGLQGIHLLSRPPACPRAVVPVRIVPVQIVGLEPRGVHILPAARIRARPRAICSAPAEPAPTVLDVPAPPALAADVVLDEGGGGGGRDDEDEDEDEDEEKQGGIDEWRRPGGRAVRDAIDVVRPRPAASEPPAWPASWPLPDAGLGAHVEHAPLRNLGPRQHASALSVTLLTRMSYALMS